MTCIPRDPRKLADVVATPHSMIFVKSLQSSQVPSDWIIVDRSRKMLGNYKPVRLISVAGKITEQIILKAVLRHIENREVVSDSQHGFNKGQSYLTNQAVFYNEEDLISLSMKRLSSPLANLQIPR